MRFKFVIVVGISFFQPLSSQAGPYQDDLLRCIGSHLVDSDKDDFAAFIAFSLSRLPTMQGIVFVDDSRRGPIIKAYTQSLERLILHDCHDEAKLVVKFEGANELFAASNAIGQMAMREKLNDPSVAKLLDEMEKYASEDDWTELLAK